MTNGGGYTKLIANAGRHEGIEAADLIAAMTAGGLDGEAVRNVRVLERFALARGPGRRRARDRRARDRGPRQARWPSSPFATEEALPCPMATMSTNHGDITIELFDEDAPKTVENFRSSPRDGFYDGLIVPPHHQGLHDPGRLPAGHRHRRPGLHVRGRDQPAQGRARLARDGQRRPEHERLAVLHRHARRRRRGWTASTPSSARSRTGWTSSTSSRACRPTAATARARTRRSRTLTRHGARRLRWPATPPVAATISVENPATGETIREVPVTAPDGGRRARGPRARRRSPPGRRSATRAAAGSSSARRSGCSSTRTRSRTRSWPRPARRARTRCSSRSPTARTRSASGRARRRSGLRTRRCARATRSSSAASMVVRYRPVGVVGVIGPWNYPLVNSVGDAIPALAAGNAVVVKPSEVTPLTSLLFERGLREMRAAGGRLPGRGRHGRDRRGADRRGRHGDVHGLDAHRPQGHGARRADAHAGLARARRQGPDDRAGRRRPRARRQRRRLLLDAERRPDLHLDRARVRRGAGLRRVREQGHREDVGAAPGPAGRRRARSTSAR